MSTSDLISNYEQQVYASVLGKIIGVYMGRPFEGWPKHAIQEKWGQIDRYVNEDLGHDLVVSDDDITGTFTFVRALEDLGKFEETTAEDFGRTWMNYLIEHKTILWWGGMGLSTEHTAYLRMKNGVMPPQSGSCALNGQIVAEQIGAQIFIDAIGMCFPGQPERAAKVAAEAARVSHDGEAVYAAQMVASMVAMAFEEKDLNTVMDHCVTLIPEDSLIAELHRNVRAWAKEDGDWEKTFERIDKDYGYHKYGGNCHVIPNHAIMVLAWAYAPNDFHLSQVIINTAGWDTDCNAANVGSVMGLICGLDGINKDYDYQTPFADRVLMPTAEGSRGTSDALLEAHYIAAMGRRCMEWPALEAPKDGAWLHFSQPGAFHGLRPENLDTAKLSNTSGEALTIVSASAEETLISKPVLTRPEANAGGYGVTGTPRIYPGYKLTAKVPHIDDGVSVKLFARIAAHQIDEDAYVVYSDALADGEGTLCLTIPAAGERHVLDFGFAISGKGQCKIDSVGYQSEFSVGFAEKPLILSATDAPGYVMDLDKLSGAFSDDPEKQQRFVKSEGRGLFTTGSDDWRDYTVSARLNTHLSEYIGLLARYQGQDRSIELRQKGDELLLIEHFYGEHVLASCESPAWAVNEFHELSITCAGDHISASLDGVEKLQAEVKHIHYGGCGCCFANGIIGMRDFSATSSAFGQNTNQTSLEALAVN